MFKKTISSLLALCLLLAMIPYSAFAAVDMIKETDIAKKAIRHQEKQTTLFNDITMDEILSIVKKLIPEDCPVTLSFSKESDLRVYNATTEKAGSVFANFAFTCEGYTTHDMYTFAIPVMTDELSPIEEQIHDKTPAPSASPEPTKAPEPTQAPEPTKEPEETKEPTTPAPKADFADVAADAYYAEAVNWAVEKNITTGTTDTTFSPEDTCTRAQILTFLWRAVGAPKSEIDNPFTDVTADDYFYGAALWAYEKGMVEEGTFAGNTPCTRSMTVIYLWINADLPEAIYADEFDDVSEDADYAEAVAWAVDAGVTSGTSDTTFSPEMICNRAQIVTFLMRAIG